MPKEEIPKIANQPAPEKSLSEEFETFKKKSHEAFDRLSKIVNAKEVLDVFLENGVRNSIAYEMPLGEVLGFLDEREKEAKHGDYSFMPPDMEARNIGTARDFLVLFLDEHDSKITSKTKLIEVITRLEGEIAKLADIAANVAELET
jgi:hypothetical protein